MALLVLFQRIHLTAPHELVVDDWHYLWIEVVPVLFEGKHRKSTLPIGDAINVLSVQITSTSSLNPDVFPTTIAVEVHTEPVRVTRRATHSLLLKLTTS